MSDLTHAVTVPPVALPQAPSPALPGYPQSRSLRHAHSLWLRARGRREMPAWTGIATLLPEIMRPCTILFELQHEPFDFRYAEIGSRIRAISNADHTGRCLSDLPHQRPPSKVWDHLSAAAEARAPVRGVLPYIGRVRDISSIFHIVLPLADDGERVDRLLVCVDFGAAIRLEDGTHPFTQLG